MASTPELMAENIVRAAGETGSDIVYVGTAYPNVMAAALGGGLVFGKTGAPELKNPFIASDEDVDRMDPAMVDAHWLMRVIKEALRLTRQRIGNELLVTMTAWGPFTLSGRVMGEERWLKCLYKNPALAHRLLGFMTRLLIHVFKPLLDEGQLEVIMLGEPSASGDLISRAHFRDFAVPYAAEFSAWAKGAGGEVMIHVCGDTADRLELFLDTGAAIVSLDGKVDMAKIRDTFEGKICYAGNLDPVRVLLNGGVEEVRRASREALAKGGPGMILTPGCDLPPGVPLENIRAMMDTAREWKR
jgi:uroporphyrinogen decarboxylase